MILELFDRGNDLISSNRLKYDILYYASLAAIAIIFGIIVSSTTVNALVGVLIGMSYAFLFPVIVGALNRRLMK